MLSKSINILLFFVLSIAILYFAKPLLAPLTVSAILAMLFLPVARWLERRGMQRIMSSLCCVICFMTVIAGISAVLRWQLNGLMDDLNMIEKHVNEQLNAIQQYINDSFGITPEKQKQLVKDQAKSSTGVIPFLIEVAISATLDFILMIVYFFILLYMRSHIATFILKLVPTDKKQKAGSIINECCHVAQHYLVGLSLMVASLWVMYGIGFSIIGVKHALFFAILCGLLEIIPFVGNFTGNTLTALMVISQGGSTGMVVAVICTYLSVQLIQSYILEPLVVGREVNINPLFTILALIAGELVWGITGMMVALPCLAIIKIIFDRIPALSPYGYLMGNVKNNKVKRKG